MNLFKNLTRYLYDHFIWVSKIKSLWGVIFPFASLHSILLVSYDLNNLVRYVGLALELLGLITVALGLKGKRELFKKPGFIQQRATWWNQRPAWKPSTVIANGTFTSASSTRAKGNFWHGAKDESIEGRLVAIENNLLSIQSEIQLIEQEASNNHTKLVQEIESERQTRQSSILEISSRLEDLAAKDINFEALGVYWLFWGLVYSSLPSEIAGLLNY